MANILPIIITNKTTPHGATVEFSDRNLQGVQGTAYQYLNTDTSGQDGFWSDVITVLHFDGTNGQTTGFADSGPYALTVSGSNGMSYTGSAQFGATCLNTGSSAGRVKVTGGNEKFYISASTNFTIEYWFKKFDTTDYNEYLTTNEFGSNGIRFIITNSPAGWYMDDCAGGNSLFWQSTTGIDNAWHHVAWTRLGTAGNNITLWIDGTARATATSNAAYSGSGPLVFGGDTPSSNDATQTCIDEFRWTQNICRYTGSFTPAGPFPSK